MFNEARALWLYQHYLWLETALPPRSGPSPLILPTREFFPNTRRGDELARELFERVRELMGLQQWPCRLEPESDEEAEFRAAMQRSGVFAPIQRKAAGTFSAGEEVVITYSRSLNDQPMQLVATLAHELCHYLLATVQLAPPAGWEELEPLTDLAAVHEGFGVILANSAFQFSQWADAQMHGWQSSTPAEVFRDALDYVAELDGGG